MSTTIGNRGRADRAPRSKSQRQFLCDCRENPCTDVFGPGNSAQGGIGCVDGPAGNANMNWTQNHTGGGVACMQAERSQGLLWCIPTSAGIQVTATFCGMSTSESNWVQGVRCGVAPAS